METGKFQICDYIHSMGRVLTHSVIIQFKVHTNASIVVVLQVLHSGVSQSLRT